MYAPIAQNQETNANRKSKLRLHYETLLRLRNGNGHYSTELAERLQANAELLLHSPFRVQKNAARCLLDKHISTESAQDVIRFFLRKVDHIITGLGNGNTIQPSEIVELL